MKNILFIITKNDVGGAQKFVSDQLKIAHENGFICHLATNRPGWIEEITTEGITSTFYDQGIEHPINIPYVLRLWRYLRKKQIGLVVCNSANGGLYGRLAGFLAGCKSIYVSHGWSSIYNGGRAMNFLNFVERMLAIIGTRVLCISKGDIEKAKRFIHVPQRKLLYIPNAILPFPASVPSARGVSGIRLLTIARLSRPKRLDLLLRAMKGLDGMTLDIVGDGDQKSELTEFIASEKLPHVHLKGEITNFKAFADYDIFLLISDSEGMPMSAIEAMSFGLPLILSDVGGCFELIKDNGVLVQNNVESIQQAILHTVQNRVSMGSKSTELFNLQFNLHNRKSDFLAIYESLLA